VTTLHTVTPNFSPKEVEILKYITQRSEATVLITGIAKELLEKQGIHSKNYVTIPHGCPRIERIDMHTIKTMLGLENRFVISTFGLINRAKGIEYVIHALPKVIEKQPNLIYLIIGENTPRC
jgi:hypothetical protein